MIYRYYHERSIPSGLIVVHFVHHDDMHYTLCGDLVDGAHRYLWLGAPLMAKEEVCPLCAETEAYGLWMLSQIGEDKL